MRKDAHRAIRRALLLFWTAALASGLWPPRIMWVAGIRLSTCRSLDFRRAHWRKISEGHIGERRGLSAQDRPRRRRPEGSSPRRGGARNDLCRARWSSACWAGARTRHAREHKGLSGHVLVRRSELRAGRGRSCLGCYTEPCNVSPFRRQLQAEGGVNLGHVEAGADEAGVRLGHAPPYRPQVGQGLPS